MTLNGLLAERTKRETELKLREIESHGENIRQRCQSFAEFVKEAWHVIEPGTRLSWNWHLQAMCDHLEAISRGTLQPRLIINIPPGSSKSTIVTVMWQAYEWGPLGMPSMRYLTTSYELENVTRDTRKTRNLIRSLWFQALWPIEFTRTGETSFENKATGTREGTAFSSLTAKRGDRLIVDDPHSLKGAESETQRNNAVRDFLEGGLNRLNDQAASVIVVVMQRLHATDLAGALLARDLGFIHLCLPMEFEADKPCETPLGLVDKRKYDGELLDPQRFPREEVEKLKKVSAYAWASQYQQRPSPREGGLFKLAWFADKFIRADAIPRGTKWVRHWDLAASKKSSSAWTVGVKIGRMPDGRYVVSDVKRVREDGFAVRKLIKLTAQLEPDVLISLPQDPGQAGKVQKDDFALLLDGFRFVIEIESGEKQDRAEPFSSQCEAGNVYLVEADWNDSYLNELTTFPTGAFKDQVDASSGAYGQLVKGKGPIIVTEAMMASSQHIDPRFAIGRI